MPRIFLSQNILDQWMGQGSITLDGDLLRIASTPQTPLYVNPAVYFEQIDGSEHDPYDIVGAVKTSQEIAQMGADHYETSVVLGDHAYSVKPGFVATPLGPDGSEAQLDGTSWGALLGHFGQLGAG